LPPHVHIGGNDGPRISTITFQPLSDADAGKMSKKQKTFCENLSSEQRSMIKKRSKGVYKFGAFKKGLFIIGVGISILTAESMQDFVNESISDLVPGGVGDVY
jgi:hypothetical protein